MSATDTTLAPVFSGGPTLRDPGGVVGRIARRKRLEVQARAAAVPLDALPARDPTDLRDFGAALRAEGLGLIAEVKPRSPSRGPIAPDLRPDRIAQAYRPCAAAISVLCDGPDFGGSHALLSQVRALVPQPVLCKDFLLDPYQVFEARAAGADAVLLMVSLLPPDALRTLLQTCAGCGLQALVEVHDADELEQALGAGAAIVGINSRDLRTLQIDLARIEALAARVPAGVVRVGESGVQTRADVERLRPCCDALLVGSTLMSAPDPAARIAELGWGVRP